MKDVREVSCLLQLSSMALLMTGCLFFAPAPQFVVKGVVTDVITGKPIAGAQVSDEGYGKHLNQGSRTDSEGNYSYNTWYEEHVIVVEASGYESKRLLLKTRFIGRESQKVVDFVLKPGQ